MRSSKRKDGVSVEGRILKDNNDVKILRLKESNCDFGEGFKPIRDSKRGKGLDRRGT